MNKTWSSLSVREKVCLLYQVECDGRETPVLQTFSYEKIHAFRRIWKTVPVLDTNNKSYYYKLRVCSTWFTLYSLLSEMSFVERQMVEAFLSESILPVGPPQSEAMENELSNVIGHMDLYGLPIPSMKQCLTKKTEDVLFLLNSV